MKWPQLMLTIILFAAGISSPAAADDYLSLLVTDSDSYMVFKAVEEFEAPDGVSVRAFCLRDLENDPDKAAFFDQSRIVIVDVMDDNLADFAESRNLPRQARVLALRGSKDDKTLVAKGFEFNPEVSRYFDFLSVKNVVNMICRALALEVDPAIAYAPVEETLEEGLYHPAAAKTFATYDEYMSWYRSSGLHDPARPTLGLMFFSTYLIEGQIESLNELVDGLEKGGFNMLPAFGHDQSVLENFFMDPEQKARVDAVLSFGLKFYVSYNEGVKKALLALDVPIFNGLKLYSQTLDEWRASDQGVASMDVVWNLDNPEVSGAIEPTVLMAKVEEVFPDGSLTYRYELIDEQLQRLMPRIRNWIELRSKPNAEKKIAVLYYNNSRGKQNIGASYLNIFRSLETLTAALADAGYALAEDLKLDEETIKDLVLKGGINIGSWAPGELDNLIDSGLAELLDVAVYKEWFAELPADFRAKVTAQWGEPEDGGPMIRDGKIVIPMVRAGNVVMLPEPARGEVDDPLKLYHDLTMQPHHQYIAAYLWLKRGFDADAVIHLGTHGTHEWLPGKQSGLSASCPPEVLGTDIPSVYPYIMDNIGEGLQAKRRGRAVVVDHLIPLLVEAGNQADYDKLKDLLVNYEQAQAVEAVTVGQYLEAIGRLTADLGLEKDLNLSFTTPEEIQKLSQYLEYLELATIPYGLHTLGLSPAGEELDGMVEAIRKKSGGEKSEEALRADLRVSGPAELKSILGALSGHYVEPGEGNDPVRNPDAIPVGRNFYGLSPAYMPTRAAWKLGQEAADQIIRDYLAAHSEYPDKVAVVLWAVESLRNEGLNESTILSLIGVEPIWSENGRILGSRPIPAHILGRPRVDVMVDISGLYRDLFPDKVIFIDKAFRQAAAQDDLDNFVRQGDQKNYQALLDLGFSEEEAGRFSKARIFSEAPGAYGNRVSELVSASGLWEDRKAISDVFKTHTAFAYGADVWGAPAREALEQNLSGAKVAWHSVSSNLYAAMDNDDVFMFLGGLSSAIESLDGESPALFLADQRSQGQVQMTPLAQFLGQEVRSRYLNSKWIEGMMAEKYAGAAAMAHYVEYLWGWQVTTPEEISPELWNETYSVYVEDKYELGVDEFMDAENAWAYQSLTGRMLESIRKGFWEAPQDVQEELSRDYAVSVITRGVACCDHTCNNPQFHQMVLNIISLPGVLSPELVAEFKMAVEKAGQASLEEMVAAREQLLENLEGGSQGQAIEASAEAGPESESELESVRGLKMETVTADEETSLPSSGVEWTASVFVLAIVVLLFFGLRGRRKGQKRG
ncbi:MAG: cobaltochelatase subunit CobN [Deltaproteobacteria bacterium]|jgi:cobaltochelatase CobN|nr:cobaltochelatase subunit CobN [Deltaproteobacteria bacterium]